MQHSNDKHLIRSCHFQIKNPTAPYKFTYSKCLGSEIFNEAQGKVMSDSAPYQLQQ
jgi:hypothetical protein